MKKLIKYLIGFLTLFGVFAMIFVVAVINDAANRVVVSPYFLRTDITSSTTADLPRSMSDLSNKRIRDWLIQKFVVEYFYAVPDEDNIEKRTEIGRSFAPLNNLATSSVFERWASTEANEIRKLVTQNAMRTVTVFDEIFKLPDSNYWRVDYELKTWYKPNDMSDAPVIERGTMYIALKNDDAPIRLGRSIEEIGKLLQAGKDPSGIFSFRVDDVKIDR